jgi:formate dehydrogenase maturation protein FdhE
MTAGKWDARIERAHVLEREYPFASEGLRFYAQVAGFQKSIYSAAENNFKDSAPLSSAWPLREKPNLSFLLPRFPEFLSLIERIAPSPLSDAARELAREAPPAWEQALEDFWSGGAVQPADGQWNENESGEGPLGGPLPWIFLQPYAECLADASEPDRVDATPLTCPRCGSKPIVGVLRREGDGAKKSLICMLCAREWAFRRLYCPGCGEEREPQLAFYSSPEIGHVRVDVCDTCHTYLKSVDLTKTGLAVPVVDELATIPLDLWAREHGYHKLQINLLGM